MSNFAYFFLILFGWLPMCLTKENSSRKECKWKNIIWITVRPFFKVLQIFQKYGSFIFLNVILFYAYLKSDTMKNISASYTAHTALTAFNISNLTTLFCLTIFTANSQRKLKSIFEKMELIKKIIGVNYLVTKPVRRTLSILKIIILISLIFDLHHIFNSSLSSLGINLTITHMLVSSLVTVYICCLASCFTSKIFKFVNIQIVSRIRITNGLLGSRDKCHDLDHHTFATVELVQINGKLSMAHRLQNELNDYIYIPVILVVYNLGVALTLGLLQFTEPSRPVHIKALIISMVASCIFLLAILCSAPDLVLMTKRQLEVALLSLRVNPSQRTEVQRCQQLLAAFPGFDMGRFFTLGRSTIVSILSFIFTNMVIMLQFRGSEVNGEQYYDDIGKSSVAALNTTL